MRHLILRRLWSLRPPSICELFQFPYSVSVPVSIPCVRNSGVMRMRVAETEYCKSLARR